MNVTFEYLQDGKTITGQYYKTGVTTFIFLNNKENEIVYLTAVGKYDYEKFTHVFDNDNGEVLEDNYIYFVKVTDLNGNILVEENTRVYCIDDVPHTKVYGICGSSKCKVPVLPLENIYVSEEIKTTGTVYTVEYPEGFDETNSIVLSIERKKKTGTTWGKAIDDVSYTLKESGVYISSMSTSYYYRVCLLRFK